MISEKQLYELGMLPETSMGSLQTLFDELPLDTYAEERLRSRRYSRYRLENGKLRQLSQQEFMQTKDINEYLGDVEREYEPIDDSLTSDPVFIRMFEEFFERTGISAESVIEAHQIRWHCKRYVKVPAPEGIHKDGFDFIAIYMVQTHNLDGGDIMIYPSLESAPVFRKKLSPGEYVVLNDKELYHYAAPLVPTTNDEDGFWDLIVLTANDAAVQAS